MSRRTFWCGSKLVSCVICVASWAMTAPAAGQIVPVSASGWIWTSVSIPSLECEQSNRLAIDDLVASPLGVCQSSCGGAQSTASISVSGWGLAIRLDGAGGAPEDWESQYGSSFGYASSSIEASVEFDVSTPQRIVIQNSHWFLGGNIDINGGFWLDRWDPSVGNWIEINRGGDNFPRQPLCADISPGRCRLRMGFGDWVRLRRPIESSGIVVELASAPLACAADLNWDGVVDAADLGVLLSRWGYSAGTDLFSTLPIAGIADLDCDGSVGGGDIAELLLSWGQCP